MWVWDSTTFIATNGEVSTERWEPDEDDMLPPISANTTRGELVGRILATIILAGFVGYLFWALPI